MTSGTPSRREQSAASSREDFERLAEPFRRELKLHCYRMLGSVHEAEDLVQETFLRAWRGFGSLEERGAIRPWLYRIATNACLNALESRKAAQRFLPDGQAPASATVGPLGDPALDVPWLEPYPDSGLDGIADAAPNPLAHYTSGEAVQLAFVAAIQQLPPRQRAALLLCDVLGWTAAEAATLLGGSPASIHSAQQRARETLAAHYPEGRPAAALQPTSAQQQLLGRYLRAWEGHDLDGFVALLKEDAPFIMPPWPQWYAGREAIRSFFGMAWRTCHGMRLVPTAANRQPAFAVYDRAADGSWRPNALHVLTLEGERIARMTLFVGPVAPRLFEAFGMPATQPEGAP